jgi:hypothetical protein
MRNTVLLVLASMSMSSLACGYSPLLNHQTAQVFDPNAPVQRSAPVAGDCPLEFPKSGLCASLTWDTALSSEDENTGTLRFWDKATSSAAGPYRDASGDVGVMLWMPAMGHGSSPVTVTAQGGGTYAVTKAYFVMPGDWDVRVQLKQNHQLIEQAVLSVKL